MSPCSSNNANSTAHYPPPCSGCGLTSSQIAFSPETPFEGVHFDFSDPSLNEARRIAEEVQPHITALDDAIKRLTDRRERLQRVYLDHIAFLPLIARLTDDVLVYVFEFCADPWSISAVCRRWRLAALSSPNLWIKLTVGGKREEPMPSRLWMVRCCQRLELQLQRSRQTPFECYANFGYGSDEFPLTLSIQPIIQELWSNLYKCLRLELVGTPPESLSTSDTPPRLPLLHTLILLPNRPHLDDSFLSDAPALRNLTVANIVLRSAPFPNKFATISTGLTSLKLCHCAIVARDLLEILRGTMRLERLTITPVGTPTMQAFPVTTINPSMTQIVHLARLREIDINFSALRSPPGHNPRTVRNAIEHIRAPNLGTIRLRQSNEEDVVAVQQWILASGNPSSVTSLSILEPMDVDCNPVVSLISHLPSIQSLAIRISQGDVRFVYDPLFLALKWPTDSEEISPAPLNPIVWQIPPTELEQLRMCPRIRQIALWDGSVHSGLLWQMVESRIAAYTDPSTAETEQAYARFELLDCEEVNFTDDEPHSNQHMDWLEEMKENGLIGSDRHIWESLEL